MERILVIKLSALGNLVLSLPSFAAIRRHHRSAEITLLTTAPYAQWMAESAYFDDVLVDERPAWWNLPGVLRLRRMLIAGRFQRVYDLQSSSRSSHYFRLFPRRARPEWSGTARGCSHFYRAPERPDLHDVDRRAGQLRQAGIDDIAPPDLSWMGGDIARFVLPRPFALLVPGSSPHRPQKRWPAENYRLVAVELARRGIAPVLVGTSAEHGLGESIGRGNSAINLVGQTSLGELAELARAAAVAIGNDTGPMHLFAAAGCASLVLFSSESDPARCAPRGRCVRVLRRGDLGMLTPQAVLDALPDPAELVA